MKIINKGNTNIAQLIRKKHIETEALFRLSNFVYLYSNSEYHVLKYTLTGMIIELSELEWQLVSTIKTDKITGSELQEKGLLYLAENCILVAYDFDEYKHYALAIHVLKTLSSNKNNGVKSYTILPTTACNAKCIYCYEEGMSVRTMMPEIIEHVVNFILRTKRDDKITINWFGGEPLIANDIISKICYYLDERDVSFCSKVITNATLFTKDLVKEAKDLWHLDSAQVSVDGNKYDYEIRKKYHNPSIHNYNSMMNAISYLLEQEIKVTLRCNYDSENLAGIRDFLEDIKTRFGFYKNLSVYFAMLFQENNVHRAIDERKEIIDIIRYYRDLGMNCVAIPNRDYQLKINFCMADSDGKHVVIDPDGSLYHCEHLPDNVPFGHINDKDLTIDSDDRADISVDSKCRQCCFLPYCTPFFKNACPNWSKYCYELKCLDMNFLLEQTIRKEYAM